MLTRRELILAKPEVTYNTDAVPTGAADAILVENLNAAFDSVRMNERPAVRSSMGQLQKIFGGALKAVSFDVEIKGSGTAGTAPEIAPLLQAAGFAETVVASTSVTYDVSSDAADHKSVTLYYYQDGFLQKITGARCMSFALACNVGAVAKLSMTFVGHDAGTSDTVLVTPTYDATVPPPFLGATFQIGAYAPTGVNALNFDLGLTLAKQPDVNAADGYGELLLTGRNPTGSFDPNHVLKATHDYLGIFKAGTTAALQTGVIGSTAGNRYAIDCDDIYYDDSPSQGEREGVRTLEIPFAMTDETTTDSELTIQFT